MINDCSVLAIIPARIGSKGLPRKNILPLAGKPLITWAIDAAKASKYIDRFIISTDSFEIADEAKSNDCDVPFMRPTELATDTASSNDVFLHALENLEEPYDILLILQPTSPLRTSVDIDSSLELMIEKNAPSVVSVCKSHKPIYWNYTLEQDGTIKPIYPSKKIVSNRQEFPATYIPNGAVYIIQVEYFKNVKTFYTSSTIAYIMPAERSIDIDSQLDFNYAELLLNNQ